MAQTTMLFEEQDGANNDNFPPEKGQPPSLDSLFEARLAVTAEDGDEGFGVATDETVDAGLYFIASFADL